MIPNVPLPPPCNCGITWASPTPRPICPTHGMALLSAYNYGRRSREVSACLADYNATYVAIAAILGGESARFSEVM